MWFSCNLYGRFSALRNRARESGSSEPCPSAFCLHFLQANSWNNTLRLAQVNKEKDSNHLSQNKNCDRAPELGTVTPWWNVTQSVNPACTQHHPARLKQRPAPESIHGYGEVSNVLTLPFGVCSSTSGLLFLLSEGLSAQNKFLMLKNSPDNGSGLYWEPKHPGSFRPANRNFLLDETLIQAVFFPE